MPEREREFAAMETKKNLPLLRAVKEGKLEVITSLIEGGNVDVNFHNHCAPAHRALGPRAAAARDAVLPS